MKLTYRRCGDYYLPNIGIPADDMRPLGKYGRMHMRYLREHQSLLFNQLLLSGKLMKHLYSINDACQERLDLLIPQMKAEHILKNYCRHKLYQQHHCFKRYQTNHDLPKIIILYFFHLGQIIVTLIIIVQQIISCYLK